MLIMTVHSKLMVYVLLLAGFACAQNYIIENYTRLIEPAIVEVLVHSEAELTIEGNLLPGFEEIIGRNYSFSAVRSLSGAVVNPDGYILSARGPVENATIISETIDYAAPLIIGDTGKIDHLKRYGQPVGESEMQAYRQYFVGMYGENGGFEKELHLGYKDGRVSIEILRNDIYIRLSKSSDPVPARLIDLGSGIALFKIDKANMPVVELRNASLRNGDEVFVITRGDNKTEHNFIQRNGTEINLLRNNDDGSGGVNVITDGSGRPLAFELNDVIITSDDLYGMLGENDVVRVPSRTNLEFEDALESFDNGDYPAARQKLENTLDLYPEHGQAREYLREVEDKTSNGKGMVDEWAGRISGFLASFSAKIPSEAILLALAVVMAVLSVYVIGKLGLLKKGRRQR